MAALLLQGADHERASASDKIAVGVNVHSFVDCRKFMAAPWLEHRIEREMMIGHGGEFRFFANKTRMSMSTGVVVMHINENDKLRGTTLVDACSGFLQLL